MLEGAVNEKYYIYDWGIYTHIKLQSSELRVMR